MQLPMDSFTLTQQVNKTMKQLDKDMTMKLSFEEFKILFANILKNQHKSQRDNLLSQIPNIDKEKHWLEMKEDIKKVFNK